MYAVAGAGMIFSQGLMRMRAYDEIEEAVRTMNWAHQGAGGAPPPPAPPYLLFAKLLALHHVARSMLQSFKSTTTSCFLAMHGSHARSHACM